MGNLKNKKLNGQMQYNNNTKEKMMDYAENKKSQQMNKRTVGLKKKVSKDEEVVEAEGNKIDNNSSADHEWKKVSKKKNFGHRAIPIAAILKNPSGVNETSNAKLPEYADGKMMHRYKRKNNLKNKKLNGQMQYNTKEKMMDDAENKKN